MQGNQELLNLIKILDNTIEGILIIKDGFIQNVNEPLLNMIGYEDKEEIVGKLATGLLIPQVNSSFIEYNSTMCQEITIMTKNAKPIPAIIKIKDIILNEETYKMVSVVDITEIKEKEKLLLKQSKLAAMGEMISVIAHQWKQPLNAIASINSRLKLKLKMKNDISNELLEEKTKEIETYIHYMSETVDDFKNFFKPNNTLELTNLIEVTNDALKIVEESLRQENINIELNLQNLNLIRVYKNELVQVVLNILNNAKDALVENKIETPKITIDFEEDDYSQKITIRDNAGGIPYSVLPKIFDPYFSTKEKKNGTGLGLYISKTIIEKHLKGELIVRNDKKGAVFTISIAK